MPKISVIVPVYNTEKYLGRCIDSILAQTFTDFELLLVDDGSTDKSGVICDEYAAKDARIRVFHKQNGGVSSARNLGIDNATGEWLSFVDADDWVEPTYLENLFSGSDADLVVNSFVVENGADIWRQEMHATEFSLTKGNSPVLPELLKTISFQVPWCKILKFNPHKSDRIHFNETMHSGEDTLFVLQYLQTIDVLKVLPDKLYHYNRGNSNSLSQNGNDINYVIKKLNKLLTEYTNLSIYANQNCDTAARQTISSSLNTYLRNIKGLDFISTIKIFRKILGTDIVRWMVEHPYAKYISLKRGLVKYCVKHKNAFTLTLISKISDKRLF